MEQVYSYNTGALMGHIHIQDLDYEIDHSQRLVTSLSHGPATKKMTSKSYKNFLSYSTYTQKEQTKLNK